MGIHLLFQSLASETLAQCKFVPFYYLIVFHFTPFELSNYPNSTLLDTNGYFVIIIYTH